MENGRSKKATQGGADYEKKYKEALERLKGLIEGTREDKCTIVEEDIIDIFPELAESEDEKIRKEIYSALRYLETELSWDALGRVDILDAYAWLEKQGEKKPIDKVEPKFNVGDWITNSIETVQITGYDIDYGYQVDYKGNLHHRDTDIIEKEYHLWTIQDAKDGDVLLSKHNRPFIYNGIFDEENVGAYLGICSLGTDLLKATLPCNWTYKEGVKPATKEQRDLLFEKMHEAGYMWDAESKQILSFKAEPTREIDGFDAELNAPMEKYEHLGVVQDNECDEEIVEAMKNVSILDLVDEQKPKWSDEDDKNWRGIIDEIEANKSNAPDYDIKTYDNFLSWLDNIKQRMEE